MMASARAAQWTLWSRHCDRQVIANHGCVEDFARWVHLVTAMLRGGFTAEDAGKIAGGNYMRIFHEAVG
jgi:microsomal dipeptidase-like Zn-dependent dipeptidase